MSAGAGRQQPADGGEEVGLSLVVEAGGGLVEEEQRRVADQRTSQGETLPLAGRQSGPSLSERSGGTVGQSVDNFGEPGGLERRRHLGVCCVRPAEPHVLGDRAREQVRPLRHPADPPSPVGQVELSQVHATEPDTAGVGKAKAEEDREDGRLAAPARTGQRDHFARLHDKVEVVHGRDPSSGVGDLEPTDREGRAPRPRHSTGWAGVACFEQFEDVRGGLHAVRAGVVGRSERPQRKVGLGGEHQDEEGVVERQPPPNRRSPTATATSATDTVASSSSTSEERNVSRRVAMVALRYRSVTSAMARACALARPKTFRVGKPATTSRKWPASRCSDRMRRAVRSRWSRPRAP